LALPVFASIIESATSASPVHLIFILKFVSFISETSVPRDSMACAKVALPAPTRFALFLMKPLR